MRHFKGKAFSITDVAAFLANPKKPDPKSRKPITDAFAVVEFQAQPWAVIFTGTPSFQDKLDSQGNFDISIPDHTDAEGPLLKSATLCIYRHDGDLSFAGTKLPVLRKIYRSAEFPVTMLDSSGHDISVFTASLPDSVGLQEDDLAKELKKAKAKAGAQSLTATIQDGGVYVHMERDGTTLKLDLSLSPTSSADLNTFIDAKIENLDIDRPGPDFISEICKSDDDIKREFLQPAANSLMVKLNAEVRSALVDAIAKQLGQSTKVVEVLFDAQVSVSFERLRFPVVKTNVVGPFTIKQRSVVPVPSIGFPRNLD